MVQMVQEISLDYQVRSSKYKIVDSETVLHAIEANSVSSIRRVSGKLSNSLSCLVHHLYDQNNIIQICRIVLHTTRILQNFSLTQVDWFGLVS